MNDVVKRIWNRARSFLHADRGNVAMMFAIALVPMCIAAGAGLDYARSMVVRSQMSDALDAAALAVGSTTGLDQSKAQALAQKYFNANYSGDTSNGTPAVTVTNYNATNGTVTVNASYNLPTTLLKVVGKNDMPLNTSTTVVWGQSKLWVALVLDNSGSMASGDSSGSKMTALKNASHQLLTILQNAATNAGDVKVSIVPFDTHVNLGASNVSASWIDWTDWEAPPPNVTLSGTDGPGTSCPFSNSGNGIRCTTGSANGSSNTNNIPSSGMICPGADSGAYNSAHRDRYYNGCWDSVIAQSQTVTSTNTTPVTTKQDCKQVGSGTITCTNQSGYPKDGTTTNNSATVITAGYTGDSTSSTSNTDTGTTSDGSKTCTGKTTKTCNWTRTISQTRTDQTITKSAYGGYTHTWRVNSHSSWGGCIMDRDKTYDYDISNTAPNTTAKGFPAANPTNCLSNPVTNLSYDWTALGTQIDNMAPNANTNQAIGVAHGWQTMTNTDPYNPGSVPANTSRYIIILSDGQNTRDRWWGNGSTEGTVEDGYIDAREKATCDAAKADGITIYSIFLNVGGGGNSAPLSYCATDSTKYFMLTTTNAVVTTFNQIAQQITNVRVSR